MPRLTLCIALLCIGCGSSSPPAAPPAPLDPACADGMGSVHAHALLAPGVSEDPRSREEVLAAAASWQLPPGVTAGLVGAPVLTGDRLTLAAEIANTTDAPRTVMLSEAGVGVFYATLVDPVLVRRPAAPSAVPGVTPPPALFPEPRAFTLAPGTRWRFETTIVLSCWEPAPGRAVRAHWWLTVHGTSLDGDVPVTLPAP